MKKINKEEIAESYCFVCKDGGSLRICDYKDCLKSYHPECVDRDDAFLDDEERWDCGWHFCLICDKTPKFHCFSCPRAVCGRGTCTLEAQFVVIRGKKGLCSQCLHLAALIEENKDVDSDGDMVDFDDPETREFLFKEYWDILKEQENLTSENILNAKNLFKKGPYCRFGTDLDEINENEEDQFIVSDYENTDEEENKRAKKRKRQKSKLGKDGVQKRSNVKSKTKEFIGWGSKVLIEFLESLGKDATKPLSQYDVESIITDYIHENNLLDPKKKRKVLCDAKLRSVLGKRSVSKHQIYSLLETHFAQNTGQSDEDPSDLGGYSSEDEDDNVLVPSKRDKKLKSGKTCQKKEPAVNTQKSCFASIITENIRLAYLKRALLEDLLKIPETFEAKIVGSIVRVKKDPYDYMQTNSHQLVQVIGIKTDLIQGGSSKEVLLQVSNRPKEIPISTLSDEDFSKEECEDLRQRMANGMLRKITVVELQKKARILHEDITKHWIAKELVRLQNLIDRANEKGWRKEVFEYRNRKELLEKPSEQSRLLQELPEVIAETVTVEPSPENPQRADEQELEGSPKLDSQRASGILSKMFGGDGISFFLVKENESTFNEDLNSRRVRSSSLDNGNGNEEATNGNDAKDCEESLETGPACFEEESSKSYEFQAEERPEKKANGEVGNEEAKSAKAIINASTLSSSNESSSGGSNNFHCKESAKDAPLDLSHYPVSVDNCLASSNLLNHIPVNASTEPLAASISPTIEDTDAVFADIDQLINGGSSSRTNLSSRNRCSIIIEETIPNLERVSHMKKVFEDCLKLDFPSLVHSDKRQDFLDSLSILPLDAEFPLQQVSAMENLRSEFSSYSSLYQDAEDSMSECRQFSVAHTFLMEELKRNKAAYETVKIQEKELDNKISKFEQDLMQLQKNISDTKQEKQKILVQKQELTARTKDRKDELFKSCQDLDLWELRRKEAEDGRASVLSAWQSFKDCFHLKGEKQQVRKESFNEELSQQFHNIANEHTTMGNLEKEPRQFDSKVLRRHSPLIHIERANMENKKFAAEVIQLSDDDEQKPVVLKEKQTCDNPESPNTTRLAMKGAGTQKPRQPAMKAAEDPNKPKMPSSAFFIFMEEFRKQFTEKHPCDKSVAAVGKSGGNKWKSMSEAEKAPYVEEAEKRNTEYKKYTKAYNKRLAEGLNAADEDVYNKSMFEVHNEDD